MIQARYTALRTELAVILKDFSRMLLEELGADCPLPGDPSRTVTGLAVDESLKGWLGEHEAAVTARPNLDDDFLREVAAGGSPAVVWRSERKAPPEALERASDLGLALFELAPDVPLRDLLEERTIRASRSSGVEETRRERRDRYARLPDGYLSVPVERWRVEDHELFWTPIGIGAPAGYLWVDIEGEALKPEDVVLLYWARRVLEAELGKDRVRLETELGVRGDFVDDLVKGHYGSVNLLLQRAGYLGADLAAGALVLIVDIDDFARYLERRRPKEPAIQELKRRLAEAVRMQTRQLFSNFLLGPRSDNVIVFLGSSEDTPPEDLPEKAQLLAKGVQRYVKGLLPDLTISVGIGGYKEGPAQLPDAYSEATVALEIGHRIHGPSSVSTFGTTGTYKLLFRVLQENPEELEAFYGETLEPVVHYDSRYGTELVQTLITYLGNDASTVRTAGDLFAHRHTIRYRLDRVSELTGLDVDKSEDRERLTLGIKAMQLLGRVPERPSSFADR